MALELDYVSTARDILIHNCLHFFAISCLYYDHFVSFDQEIDYLWTRPRSQSSYWFFLNRYFAFFGNLVVTILGFSDLSAQVCKRYLLFRQLFLLVNQVLVCVLLTLRVYALYECSMRILTFMLGSGVTLLILPCWALFSQMSVPPKTTVSGCHVGLPPITAIRLAGAWEALFAYDSIIFSLTIYKTWKARRDHAVTGVEIPLISLILRDGAMYFSVMAICNLSNILTFYLCGPFLRGGLSTFANSISVTLMSRLMLNLHRTADVGLFTTQATSTNVDYNTSYETTSILETVHTGPF
ncbi:hypothetical protein BYT27DRAFT_7201457 [Phlegmacium glaucopus]|nr:hypothetical protein BYT27DRAFT_7201457 [Phlegmacium glaucopus]